MEMRPGKLLTIADKDSVQIEMKIETAIDLSSDTWSDLKDEAGNEIKTSVELPLDGDKRFYRFSSDWSKATNSIFVLFLLLVGRRGLEPRTNWLKVNCSTDWANNPYIEARDTRNLPLDCQE